MADFLEDFRKEERRVNKQSLKKASAC